MPNIRVFSFISFIFFTTNCLADWQEYDADTFTIISDEREKVVIPDIKLVQAANALLQFLWKKEPNNIEKPKLKIFVFSNKSDFKKYSINENVAGFYYQSGNNPYIFVGPELQKSIILHEVAHHFQLGGNSYNFPDWYAEGFAELVSTLEVRDENIYFGKAPNRLRILTRVKPMKVRPLFENDYDRDIVSSNVFYATSWALIKTILFSEDKALKAGFDRYSNQFAFGSRDFDTSIEALGISENELNAILRKSLSRARKSEITLTARIPMNEIDFDDNSYSVKPLSEEEVSQQIAHYLSSVANFKGVVDILQPHFETGDPLTKLYYHYARSKQRPYSEEEFVGFTDLIMPENGDLLGSLSDSDLSVYFSLASEFFLDAGSLDLAMLYSSAASQRDPLNVLARVVKVKVLLAEEDYVGARGEAKSVSEILPRSLESLAVNFYTSVLTDEYANADDSIEKLKFRFRGIENQSAANQTLSRLAQVSISYSDNINRSSPLEKKQRKKEFAEKLSKVLFYDFDELEGFIDELSRKNKSLSLTNSPNSSQLPAIVKPLNNSTFLKTSNC